MFSKQDRFRKDFETLTRTFGVSELVVFAYRDPELWNETGEGLERLQRIRSNIEALPGIDSAVDLSKLNQILVQWRSGTKLFGFAGQGDTSRYPLLSNSDPLATGMKKLFEGQTHSANSDLVAIACLLKKDAKELHSAANTIRSLRNIDVGQGQMPLLAGQRVMIEEGFEAIEQDGNRLGLVTLLSLGGLLLIGFRSLRWALINVVLIQWSLVVSKGLIVALSWEITMVSSMMASLVTVIAVAAVMHWMLGFQSSLRDGLTAERALETSYQQLKRPLLWAFVTDAAAFAALSFSSVGPVQDYGCMMALASLVVFAGIVCLVPVLALAFHPQTSILKSQVFDQRPDRGILAKALDKSLTWSLDHSRWIVVGSIALCAIATWQATRIEVETNFIRNFKARSPIVNAYRAIEGDLGGAGVWDVIIPIPDLLKKETVQSIRDLEDELRTIKLPGSASAPALTSVMSAVDADDVWSQNRLLKNLSFDVRFQAVKVLLGSFADSLVAVNQEANPPQRMLRIMLRSKEQIEASAKTQLISEVERIVNERVSEHGRPIVSGYYVLLTQLVSSVVADQWICLGIALIGVWIAMAVALRCMRLATLAILPNLLPSLVIMAYFGVTGTPINLGAAMIAAVSLGISVDTSLHYLTRYRSERESGRTSTESLVTAQSEIGLAVVLATMALVVGFGSLAMSDFLPTVVFGVTAALSMLGGLIGNLILLPALVDQFDTK